jgi:hypothetical protein
MNIVIEEREKRNHVRNVLQTLHSDFDEDVLTIPKNVSKNYFKNYINYNPTNAHISLFLLVWTIVISAVGHFHNPGHIVAYLLFYVPYFIYANIRYKKMNQS